MKALARIKEPKYRSKLEESYAVLLEAKKRNGRIQDFLYEPIRLEIGKKAWYKPDFLVIEEDASITLVETKGSWKARGQVAAKVRIKAAALRFPWFRFVAVYPDGKEEEF